MSLFVLDAPLMEDILEETQSIKLSPELTEESTEDRPQLDSPNQVFPIPTGEAIGSVLLLLLLLLFIFVSHRRTYHREYIIFI